MPEGTVWTVPPIILMNYSFINIKTYKKGDAAF